MALCQCKLLHKITMNKITNQTAMPSNRGITLEGVRKLVKELKFLEFISFGSIGKIINHADFDPIKNGDQLDEEKALFLPKETSENEKTYEAQIVLLIKITGLD